MVYFARAVSYSEVMQQIFEKGGEIATQYSFTANESLAAISRW